MGSKMAFQWLLTSAEFQVSTLYIKKKKIQYKLFTQ